MRKKLLLILTIGVMLLTACGSKEVEMSCTLKNEGMIIVLDDEVLIDDEVPEEYYETTRENEKKLISKIDKELGNKEIIFDKSRNTVIMDKHEYKLEDNKVYVFQLSNEELEKMDKKKQTTEIAEYIHYDESRDMICVSSQLWVYDNNSKIKDGSYTYFMDYFYPY